MDSSVQQFTAGIDGLLSYIDFEEAKAEYFKDGLSRYSANSEFDVEFRFFVQSVIFRGTTNGKRFLYNSVIVSLYGYLESYLENIAEEYIFQLGNDCDKYVQVPSTVRDKHLELSIDLVRETRRNRNMTKEEKSVALKRIVSNMNSCINEQDNFTLNGDAYSVHTANFRYDTIHTLFRQAGVTGILRHAVDHPDLKNEIGAINILNGVIDKKILISLLTAELDDLAQRRNEISHGSLNSDLQSLELYRGRTKFIRCLGLTIHAVLREKLDEYLFPVISKFDLGAPNRVFQKHNVLGFQFIANPLQVKVPRLKVGDSVFSFNEKSNRKLIVGKVLALYHNNQPLDEISFDKDATVTIKVDFKITSHMTTREISFRL